MRTKEQKARLIKWAEALESGKYKQGRGALKDKDQFCCLGVSCDVYRKQGQPGRWGRISGTVEVFRCGDEWQVGVLPSKVAAYFGLSSTVQSTLIERNDGHQWGFPAIARHIRRLAGQKGKVRK